MSRREGSTRLSRVDRLVTDEGASAFSSIKLLFRFFPCHTCREAAFWVDLGEVGASERRGGGTCMIECCLVANLPWPA